MNDITIQKNIIEKWQNSIDLIAEILDVPATLIMKVETTEIIVFLSSKSEGNPYKEGEKASLGTGLYCETVIKERSELLVPNALVDSAWKENPDIKLNMVSYLGFPFFWPDGEVFGTICVLDKKENSYSILFRRILEHFRNGIDTDLKLISEKQKISDLLGEEKKAQRELYRANQFFETIFEHPNMMLAHMDRQFNFIRVNTSYAKADDKVPSFFPGKNHFELYPNKENEAIFHQVANTGKPHFEFAKTFEYAEHPEREMSHWDWSLAPVFTPSGTIEGLILTLMDVTERVKSQKKVFRLATVINQAEATVVITDLDAKIIYANPSFRRTTGYTVKEAEGQNPRILQGKKYESGFYKDLWDTITSGDAWKGIFLNKRKNGTTYYEDATIFPIKDSSGEIINYAAVKQDVTDREHARERLEKTIEEKNILLKELYHRTKNNMQVIVSLLTLQEVYSENSQLTETFDLMKNRIYAMSLVHQKLYESRNLSSIDLKEYYDELVIMLLDSLNIQPENISIIMDTESIHVLIDIAIPCGLILNELLTNALKHAFPDNKKGEITIRLRRQYPDNIEFRITDNGIGLPPDFDSRSTKTLGMQLIHTIGESQLQGKVEFSSNRGTTCTIRFRSDLYNERV